MAERKISEHHIRKIGKKNKYTYYITLPAKLIDDLRWRQGQKVTAHRKGDGILVLDWVKK